MDKQELQEKQKLPLDIKIKMSQDRIEEWCKHWKGQVYVSFSGGKDSTVLLDIVRKMYPDVPAVFMDTGLEYPEIRNFVKTIKNVSWLRPKQTFKEVIEQYGYPIISKENAQKIKEIRNTKSSKLRNIRLYGNEKGYGKLPIKWRYLIDADFKISNHCCYILKKYPAQKYEKKTGRKPFVGGMASESRNRYYSYLRTGCNNYSKNRPMSLPISFWLEKDIWKYIKVQNLSYSSIYDMGNFRSTGCMFCMFGVHLEKGENRFQRMKRTHPKQYAYCINTLGIGRVLDFIDIKY